MDLILNMLVKMFLTVCHFPFPGVSSVFVSLRSFGDCPLGDVSLYEVLRCVRRGLWEEYGAVLSGGFGPSVLAFFGERGPDAVGHGGGPGWSCTGRLGDERLGAWRSVRTELVMLLGAVPSV